VTGDNSSWRYRSAFNPDWFMGFDKKGRPLLGSDHIGTEYPGDFCFRFTKNAHVVTQGLPQNQFNVDKHNKKIGQTHPHLKVLVTPPLPRGQKGRRSTTTTTTSTTTSTTTTSTTSTTTTEPPTTTTPLTLAEVLSGSERVFLEPLPQASVVEEENPETHHMLRHHRNHGKSHHAHPRQRNLKKSQRNRKSKSPSLLPKTKTLSAALADR
jgi:hypothetical protein